MLKRRLCDAGLAVRETKRTPGFDAEGKHHRYTLYRSPYSPHSFRVLVVTDLLEQGHDIKEVARLVGHSNVKTTVGYSRVEQEVSGNLVDRIRGRMPRIVNTP